MSGIARPAVLILHATGTNRDREAAQAFALAGGEAEIVHINQLRTGERRWQDYDILALPGGFSYADSLGAGKLLALDLQVYFSEQVERFVASGKPVIGICNGFQALVKAGILPGTLAGSSPPATLTFNASGRFECRWVTLLPGSEKCLWTQGLREAVTCPVAHGEGRFVTSEPAVIAGLEANDQVALRYAAGGGPAAGRLANGEYPANPNGSQADIAGICNPRGNVLGLMPHPEDHIYPYQHPRWARGEAGFSGLPLFQNGVRHA